MVGHLHPLIIRPVRMTVWMAGRFTSFNALWAQRGLLRLGRINVERDGLEDFNFSKDQTGSGGNIRGEMVH